jgi:hypothetical protein
VAALDMLYRSVRSPGGECDTEIQMPGVVMRLHTFVMAVHARSMPSGLVSRQSTRP